MNIFAIVGTYGEYGEHNESSDELKTILDDIYPNDHREIGYGQYLIADNATSKEVGIKIGMLPENDDDDKDFSPRCGIGIIIQLPEGRATGYYYSDLWDWLEIKRRQSAPLTQQQSAKTDV